MRYTYSCAKCNNSVKKPPVSMKLGKGEQREFTGLHGWRCPVCGPTKVSRKLNGE